MSDGDGGTATRGASAPMQAGMAEATRLTVEGRLAEATAIIQRTLGRAAAPPGRAEGRGDAGEPIEAAYRVAGQPSTPTETPARGTIPGAGAASMASAAGATSRVAATSGADAGVHAGVAGGRPPVAPRLPGLARGAVRPLRARTPDLATVIPAGGRLVDGAHTNRAGTRAYKLYIPSGYRGQAVPLVVMLHGCTQGAVDFAAGTRMNVVAEGQTFLIAYPEQAASANGSKCWNWFDAAHQRRGAGEPSLIAGITRQVMAEYAVAPERVYVAGLSAGGAMAAVMGALYPDLYAAVGVHSGLAYGAAHDLPSALAAMKHGGPAAAGVPARAVPTIVFHGDRDTTVDRLNADHVLDQWAPAGDTGAGWGVTISRGQVPGGHAYTRSMYHDASGRAIMEKWIINGAGHAWSGGSPNGSYTDPRGPDASAEMARFFAEHRLG